MPFENIEQISKEIFKDSFVFVEQINNSEIRHIYLSKHLTGEQIKELESKFKILFVSNAYDEDEKRLGHSLSHIVLVAARDSEFDIQQALKNLVTDIQEIPDGDVDRYLIIDEIKKIIKENSS